MELRLKKFVNLIRRKSREFILCRSINKNKVRVQKCQKLFNVAHEEPDFYLKVIIEKDLTFNIS